MKILHLDDIFSRFNNVIFGGDTNIDLLTDTELVQSYKMMLTANAITICNKIDCQHATRTTSNKASLLDHILCGVSNITIDIKLIDSALTDHKIIYTKIKDVGKVNKQNVSKEVKVVNYKKWVHELDSIFRFSGCNDVNELIEVLITTKDKYTTIKTLKTRNISWFNYEIQKYIKIRDNFFQKS
jgi:hypothetical protein